MNSLTMHMHCLADTEALGRRLAAHLFPGAVLALNGTLGAGKTHLTRAIAEGLGIVNPWLVNSPTFVLIQEYEARWPIYHFDAYRLKDAGEFADLGAHEYFQGDGICVVEWADRVADHLPDAYLEIRITIIGADERQIDLVAHGRRYEKLLHQLQEEEG